MAETNEQKAVFKDIRNYLAGRLVGATRDRALLHEVVKCLFCRARIEHSDDLSVAPETDSLVIAKLYRTTFSEVKKLTLGVFDQDEEILMDPDSIAYVDSKLSTLTLYSSKQDPLGDLYEAFIGSDLRATEGQFFTPGSAITFLVDAIDPRLGEKIIDPACGSGGFLNYSARRLKESGADLSEIAQSIFGIEKDEYLSKLARAHISLITLQESNIVCGDSLANIDYHGDSLPQSYRGPFDIVLTNPPFGSKIVSGSVKTRADYSLAYKWKLEKKSMTWVRTRELQNNTAPQVMFIEKCITLLKQGGRLGMVVPESMISSSTYKYVVQYMRKHLDLKAIIGMPESLFKSSGKGGTHTKTCLLIAAKKTSSKKGLANKLFMAEAKWCGHDSRGNRIPRNDIPMILDRYLGFEAVEDNHLGYHIATKDIDQNVLAPRYYNPEPIQLLHSLSNSHDLVRFGDLIHNGTLELSTGDEVGKLAYGAGDIPFIRTSDISNWEIKADPKHCISEDIYDKYAKKQDVREGDILFVRDGTYLIGSCAYVSRYDERIVFQSHIYKIRIKDTSVVTPFLLLAILSSEPVTQQIQAKRFTQDIIDSIGNRIRDILLPIPKDSIHRSRITEMVETSINDRIEARELARRARKIVIGD